MRRWTSTVMLAVVLVGGAAACTSSSKQSAAGSPTPAASATIAVGATAFCIDNVTLDKAVSNASSPADVLAVLKANLATLDHFSSTLGQVADPKVVAAAQTQIAAAKAAIAANKISDTPPADVVAAGATVDTYCQVQGDGTALPADFGAGKGSAFCTADAVISAGVGAAADAPAIATFFKTHQTEVNDFAAHIPAAVQADAQTLVAAAHAVVASNDGTKIQAQAVGTAANNVDLYCGINH